MLDHSLSMDLSGDEWLTVAARQSDGPLAPNQLYDLDDHGPAREGQRSRRLCRRSLPACRGPAEGGGPGLLIYNSAHVGHDAHVGPVGRDAPARRNGCGTPAHAHAGRAGVRSGRRRQAGRSGRRVSGGWFDAGIKDGKNKLVPSVSFRVKKSVNDAIRPLSLNLAFKKVTPQGEEDFDDVYVQSVKFDGNQTAPMTVRTETGYTGDPPQSRAQMLKHEPVPGPPRRLLRQAQLVELGRAGKLRHPPHAADPLGLSVVSGAQPQVATRAFNARRCPRAGAAARARSTLRPSSCRTSSAAASCSRRRRSRPACRARGGSWRLGRRRRARVRRRDGLRGAGGAAAARRRRVRLPARRLRPAGGVPDRLDVVRRRLLGRDRGQRGRPRGVCRPVRPGRQRRHAALRGAAAARAADVLAADDAWRSARSR